MNPTILRDIVSQWHGYKTNVSFRSAQGLFTVTQERASEFAQRLDAASRLVRSEMDDIPDEYWESLVEIITNAKRFTKA